MLALQIVFIIIRNVGTYPILLMVYKNIHIIFFVSFLFHFQSLKQIFGIFEELKVVLFSYS